MTLQDSSAGLQRLREIVRQYPSLLVAYSGGVDSAVVMKVSHEELGPRAMACIGRSPSMASSELHRALELGRQFGFPCRVLDTFELDDPRYASNRGDRCYFCKRQLFEKLLGVARAEGWSVVADGVHADDLQDHAHGIRAATELGVISPLREARLCKEAVREIARELGLPVWNKPATPCLASRVPVGTVVTVARLRQIEAAEEALARLGFADVRVRHHGALARVELWPADTARADRLRQEVLNALGAAGYSQVEFVSRKRAENQSAAPGPSSSERETRGGPSWIKRIGGNPTMS